MNQVIGTSEIWMTATRPSMPFFPPYPDFRFSCMKCGSLDVFIRNEEKTSTIKCLDCQKTGVIA